VDLLPPINRQILHQLCVLLNKVMKNSGTNKMTASNLATCICPNVIKPKSDDITILINDAAHQCILMSSLITEVQRFFQNGPWIVSAGGLTNITNTNNNNKTHSIHLEPNLDKGEKKIESRTGLTYYRFARK